MNSRAVILTLDQWQILFHETMAAVLRAQEAIKRQFGLWGIVNGLWRSSRDLRAFTAQMKAISELPDGVVGEDFIRSQIPQLRKLLRSLEDLFDSAQRHGLMNRSLTRSPLGSMRISAAYTANHLETLEMSVDPEVLKAIDEGRNQIERGDFELMDQLF